MTTKQVGDKGEQKACEYLCESGYEVLFRNWRSEGGEIDIIAQKNETLIFVEVKTLPNASMDMLKTVLNYKKQQRILKTAKRFLLKHRQYSNNYLRFDVILLDMPGFPEIYHIENAFAEN